MTLSSFKIQIFLFCFFIFRRMRVKSERGSDSKIIIGKRSYCSEENLVKIVKKKKRGKRYFNQINKQMKYYLNEITDEIHPKENYEKLDEADSSIFEINDSNEGASSSNSHENKKILSKRKVYRKKAVVSESSDDTEDESSQSGNAELDGCPWKTETDSSDSNDSSDDDESHSTDYESDFETINQEKLELVGKFFSIYLDDDDSVIVVLLPGTHFYIHGIVEVSLMLGSAKIFGYSLMKKEKVVMYSPSSYSLLSIDATRGNVISSNEFELLRDKKLISGESNLRKVSIFLLIIHLYFNLHTMSSCHMKAVC